MKWKEVSHTVNQLGFLVKDKKGTWVRSCEERSKRESDVMVMADELVSCEKLDERDQGRNDEGIETSR